MRKLVSKINDGLTAFTDLKYSHPRAVGSAVTVCMATAAIATHSLFKTDSAFSFALPIAAALGSGATLALAPQIKPLARIRTEALTLGYAAWKSLGIVKKVSVVGLKGIGQGLYVVVGTSVTAGSAVGAANLASKSLQLASSSLPDFQSAALYTSAAFVATVATCLLGKAAISIAKTGFTVESYTPTKDSAGYQASFDGKMAPKNPSHSSEFDPLKFRTIPESYADLVRSIKRLPKEIKRTRQRIKEYGDRSDINGYGKRPTLGSSSSAPTLQS